MPVIMQNAAAMAYQKAVSKTRENLAEQPNVPQWLKHFGSHLEEDDSSSRPKQLVESTLHRKTRMFAESHHPYLKLSWFVYGNITSKTWFEAFILMNIVLVGIVTGLDLEYDHVGSSANRNIETLSSLVSTITLSIFTLEVALKLIAEGFEPWRYFTDKDDGYFNTFDFLVVTFSFIFIRDENGQTISFLRMLRLVRLLTFIKGVPQLRIIVAGLTQGMKSVIYIVMLLFLIIYMYSILGCIVFGENDPARFGTVSIAMASLFQVSTLASWTSIAYVSWFGCEQYLQSPYSSDNPSTVDTITGSFEGFQCTRNKPQPFLTGLFFGSYILLTSWVIMSLFVGVISMGMFQAFLRYKEQGAFSAYLDKLDENSLSEEELNAMGQTSLKQKMDLVLNPKPPMKKQHLNLSTNNTQYHKIYLNYVLKAQRIRDSNEFSLLITLTIIIVGIAIGFDTDASMRCFRLEDRVDARQDDNGYKENALDKCDEEAPYSTAITWTAQAIFTMELFVKVFAEGTKPLRYFTDEENGSWNCMDCFIVIVGFLESSALNHIFQFFPIVLLRLLRLVRVFRLAKALPRLRSIVEALVSGFSSVGWICILILVFNYIVACMFMLIFKTNDPFHFGSVGSAMFTVLRIETLDTWDQVLYIAMFGCSGYPGGYEFLEEKGNQGITCESSKAFGWIGAFALLAVTIVGAYVLPTVLIGVVSIKFDDTNTYFQAMKEQKRTYKIQLEKAKAQMPGFFTADRIEAINDLFNNLNADGDVALDMPEMAVFFHYAFEHLFGVELTRENCESLFYLLDTSKSTTIGLGEFVTFILILRQMHDASSKDNSLAVKVFGQPVPGSPHYERTDSGKRDGKSAWDNAMVRVHEDSNEMTWDSVLMSINGEEGDTLEARVSKIFKDFDSDGSGMLDVEEMREGLTSCGVPLNKAQAKYFFSQIRCRVKGKVHIDEFVTHVEEEVQRRMKLKEEEHFEEIKSALSRTTNMFQPKESSSNSNNFLNRVCQAKLEQSQAERGVSRGLNDSDRNIFTKEIELARRIKLFEEHEREVKKVLGQLRASSSMQSFYNKSSKTKRESEETNDHQVNESFFPRFIESMKHTAGAQGSIREEPEEDYITRSFNDMDLLRQKEAKGHVSSDDSSSMNPMNKVSAISTNQNLPKTLSEIELAHNEKGDMMFFQFF